MKIIATKTHFNPVFLGLAANRQPMYRNYPYYKAGQEYEVLDYYKGDLSERFKIKTDRGIIWVRLKEVSDA